MRTLDRTDKKILTILQTEGRISNAELAKRINLSPTPCLERVRRLERDEYIVGYEAKLDPLKLQAGFVTFVAINLDRTTEEVRERLAVQVRDLEEVTECYMVGGGYDYLLKIRTADMTSFRNFLAQKVSVLPEISSTHSYFVMETIKETSTLPVNSD